LRIACYWTTNFLVGDDCLVATIREIAQATAISPGTVSKVPAGEGERSFAARAGRADLFLPGDARPWKRIFIKPDGHGYFPSDFRREARAELAVRSGQDNTAPAAGNAGAPRTPRQEGTMP
jgi:hypothetical protein